MEDSIHQIVREAKDSFVYGNTNIGKYVSISVYEILQTEDAYLNSKHISGLTDSLGREKPFFNIVTAATNIWYRATDLDRKNIKFLPKNQKQVVGAFIATILLQNWMDEVNFGKFLNAWGRVLAKHGSAIPKFVEQSGQLIPSVVDWNRFIPDSIDFNAIPHIEKFYKTAAQLRNMATEGHPDYAGYDLDAVEALIESGGKVRKGLNGQQQDTLANFFEIYEVHGNLSQEKYKAAKGQKTVEGDRKIFFQQMHVISFVETGRKDVKGNSEYDDFTLYVGKEKRDPYMITHLIEEEGRVKAIGAVEYLFDAQWMQNHTIYQWKNQLDLASKLIFQTADQNLVGRNVLTAIENGDILIHSANSPLTLLNNQGHDSESLQSFGNAWKMLGQELTSTPDSLRGNTLPSGTPYRLGAILQEQAGSLFELMTENKGLYLEEMMRKFVIPHLKKKIRGNKDEIMAILDDAGVKQLDAMYIPRKAIEMFNERLKDDVLNEKRDISEIMPFNKEMEEANVRAGFQAMGNMRPIKPDELDQKTWDEIIDDEIWDNIKVEVTNENNDKNAVLTTLSTMLQTFAQADPAFAKLIRDKIAIETGVISPLELSTLPPMPAVSPPVGGQGGQLVANP